MNTEYTVETAVANALAEAERKNSQGLLFNTNDLDHEKKVDEFDDSNGDFETVYSLISLYSDDPANDGKYGDYADKIGEALREKYPDHFSVSKFSL